MKRLPLELKQEITLYLGFIKTLCLFPDIAHYVYEREEYTWGWATTNGHLQTVKWLHKNNIKGFSYVEQAYNSLNIATRVNITYYIEGCTKQSMKFAAENGHLEIVKFLHKNRTEGCTKSAMDRAAMNGHLEIVKFLHNNRTEGCTTDAMDCAASNGHLETVKWLHENRTEGCSTYAMNWIAQKGHLEIVKYLKENVLVK